MKIKALVLMCVILLALAFVSNQSMAREITVCRDPNWPQLRFMAYPVYASDTYDFSPKPQVGGQLNPDNILIADGVWTGDTGIAVNGVWHYVNWNTPYCDFTPVYDTWQPDAPSIPVEMTTDCAFVEIRDEYDNWHLVTTGGEPVLLHYGEMLIGGHHQSTNPADYRAVATNCY